MTTPLRKIIFWLHLATGCLAGTIILIMSVTGVLLAYQRQLTHWFDGDLRSIPPTASSTRLPAGAILFKGVSQKGSLPSALAIRSEPTAPAEMTFGREHVFMLDVYTGNILGESSPRVRLFFQQVENWHRWLGASNENRALGRAVTGACNAGFLLLVVSGPFLWLPRRWSWQNIKAVATFRRGLTGRARDFNWHNVIGIWCAIPLLSIVVSGVIMSYPWANNLLYRLTGNEAPVQGAGPGLRDNPRRETPERGNAKRPPDFSSMDPLWTRAEQQVPGWRSITLRLSPSGRGPMIFTIDTGNGGRPDQRSQLTLDPRAAQVLRWEPFSSYNAGRRLRSWFRFIHTGEAGGIVGQSIAGLASAGAAVLVWTGIWLACRRLVRWRKRERAARPLVEVGA